MGFTYLVVMVEVAYGHTGHHNTVLQRTLADLGPVDLQRLEARIRLQADNGLHFALLHQPVLWCSGPCASVAATRPSRSSSGEAQPIGERTTSPTLRGHEPTRMSSLISSQLSVHRLPFTPVPLATAFP
jgi:hypothetical protein